jgi:hypothetical protein
MGREGPRAVADQALNVVIDRLVDGVDRFGEFVSGLEGDRESHRAYGFFATPGRIPLRC